jgi:chemotaxis protein histidine kinase CheA
MTRRTKAKAPTPILTANVAGWRLNYHQPACFVSNRKAAAALSAGVDMRDAADVAPGCPVAIRVLKAPSSSSASSNPPESPPTVPSSNWGQLDRETRLLTSLSHSDLGSLLSESNGASLTCSFSATVVSTVLLAMGEAKLAPTAQPTAAMVASGMHAAIEQADGDAAEVGLSCWNLPDAGESALFYIGLCFVPPGDPAFEAAALLVRDFPTAVESPMHESARRAEDEEDAAHDERRKAEEAAELATALAAEQARATAEQATAAAEDQARAHRAKEATKIATAARIAAAVEEEAAAETARLEARKRKRDDLDAARKQAKLAAKDSVNTKVPTAIATKVVAPVSTKVATAIAIKVSAATTAAYARAEEDRSRISIIPSVLDLSADEPIAAPTRKPGPIPKKLPKPKSQPNGGPSGLPSRSPSHERSAPHVSLENCKAMSEQVIMDLDRVAALLSATRSMVRASCLDIHNHLAPPRSGCTKDPRGNRRK